MLPMKDQDEFMSICLQKSSLRLLKQLEEY